MTKGKGNVYAKLLVVGYFCLAIWLVLVPSALAAPGSGSISGVVTDDAGKPLRGATVTARVGNMSIARFTDASGKYLITGLTPGSYKLTATAYAFGSKTLDQDISSSTPDVGFALKPNWNPTQISSAEYISAFGNDKDVRNIEGTCQACHNFSWIMRRRGQTADEWREFIPRMGTVFFIPNLSEEKLTDISQSLEKAFGPDSPAPTQEQVHHVPLSDEALHATFRYYTPPTHMFPHSVSIAADGKVWFTSFDYRSNRIDSFDPVKEKFQEFESPTPKAVPHNPWVTRDGKVWFSEVIGRKLATVDPETGEITEYAVPEKAGVHTLREDSQGNLWNSGNVTKFDTHTKKFTVYGTPSTYDVALDAHDNAWGASGAADKPGLFRVDSKTGEIKIYPVPEMKSVRGIEVDAQQNVWFGDVTNHRLGKFDPTTEKFTYYKASTENMGIYGIIIDKKTGNLWIGDYMGANLDKFNPATGKFTEYPFPSRTQMIRFFAMDPEGRVWFTDFGNSRIGVLETEDMKISARR